MDRLRGRLGDTNEARDPEIELKFSLPDAWSVSLFVAICRKHGVHPYRYARQRRTTVIVRSREREFDRAVWPEFSRLHAELESYFERAMNEMQALIDGKRSARS